MEKDIVTGQIGQAGSYDLAIHGSALQFEVKAGVAVGSLSLVASLELDKVLDVIAAKIPGAVDDAIFALIKAALASAALAEAPAKA